MEATARVRRRDAAQPGHSSEQGSRRRVGGGRGIRGFCRFIVEGSARLSFSRERGGVSMRVK